jgi:hypothetical protein
MISFVSSSLSLFFSFRSYLSSPHLFTSFLPYSFSTSFIARPSVIFSPHLFLSLSLSYCYLLPPKHDATEEKEFKKAVQTVTSRYLNVFREVHCHLNRMQASMKALNRVLHGTDICIYVRLINISVDKETLNSTRTYAFYDIYFP